MELSAADQEKLERAFVVIRNNTELAGQVIEAAENKSWENVGNIVREVLNWLGYTIEKIVNIADVVIEFLNAFFG
jgi:hypothetical protein